VAGLVTQDPAGLVDGQQRLVLAQRVPQRDAGELGGGEVAAGLGITVSALAMMNTSAPTLSSSSARRTAWAPSRPSM
jgi:hypothetical protein